MLKNGKQENAGTRNLVLLTTYLFACSRLFIAIYVIENLWRLSKYAISTTWTYTKREI